MGKSAMFYNTNHNQEFARAYEPMQPNYQDEVTDAHVAAINRAVDPDGSRAAKREPLYNSGW